MKPLRTSLIHIVEDDPEFGSYLMELFEDEEFENVSWFKDGIEGLNASLSDLPDLVVLDLNLPMLRGEEVCRLLRSSLTNRHTRILICSDMPHAKQLELDMLKIGADRYVEKPFKEELFLKDIFSLLAGEDSTGNTEITVEIQPAQTDDSNAEASVVEFTDDEDRPKPEDPEADDFEGYKLMDVIGGGASGTVYRAIQNNLDREVALKVFLKDHTQTFEDLDRFRLEAKIMAKLNHPNIVTVFDFGQTGYTYYIVMELMKQGSVLEIIQNDLVTKVLFLDFVNQIFEALIYLHKSDIIHRDIKPGNIMVTEAGYFKLGDFGISSLESNNSMQYVDDGYVLGTKAYMGPELLSGDSPSVLSDQYALGRTLLRLFEGKRMYHPRKSLLSLKPDMPRQVSAVIEKMLQPHPEKRFDSLEEPRDRILSVMEG